MSFNTPLLVAAAIVLTVTRLLVISLLRPKWQTVHMNAELIPTYLELVDVKMEELSFTVSGHKLDQAELMAEARVLYGRLPKFRLGER